MIEVHCPCGKVMKAPPRINGRQVRCKLCGGVSTVGQDEYEVVEDAVIEDAVLDEPPPSETAEPGKKKKKKRKKSDDDGPVTSFEERLLKRDRKDQSDEAFMGYALKNFLLGLLFLALGAGGFWMFWNMEQEGGSMRVHAIVALLYNLGGKWLVAGILWAIGLAYWVLAGLNLAGINVVYYGKED